MKKLLLLFILFTTGHTLNSAERQLEIIEINGHECVANELLIKFKQDSDRSQEIVAERSRLLSEYTAESRKKWITKAELWFIQDSNRGSLEEIINELKNNESVEYVEPNYILYADVMPNDPDFDEQWGLHNTGQTGGTPDADIDAPEAWEITTGDSTIVVGVIDSGIDYNHEDLQQNIWVNPDEIPGNGIDDDENGYIDDIHGWDFYNNDSDPMDDNSHGTHVAGIIGAVGNNGIGVAGVAWNCKLMALKFLGSGNSGPTDGAISALQYSIEKNIFITNNSYGSSNFSETFYELIDYAESQNMIFIASAGNNSFNNDLQWYCPASYDLPNIISVASTDQYDELSSFSNWGLVSVDLAAPGTNIISTVPGNNYDYKNGTSMAAPFISGSIILLKSKYSEMTYDLLKLQLISKVDRLNSLIDKVYSGGRLNILNSIIDTVRLEITPCFLDFGANYVNNQTEPKNIVLKNHGNNTININSINVHTGFLIKDENSEYYSDEISSLQILENDSILINVVFNPPTENVYFDTLFIYYQDSEQNIFDRTIQLKGVSINNGTILNGGNISGTWLLTNSPYYINDHLIVEPNNDLYIESGVEVYFTGQYQLYIDSNASLKAIGNNADQIIFSSIADYNFWEGIVLFNPTENDTLTYCYISNVRRMNICNALWSWGGALNCVSYNSNSETGPFITHNQFFNNKSMGPSGRGGAIGIVGCKKPVLAFNIISNNECTFPGGGISIYDTDDAIISGNTIVNNKSFFSGGAIHLWNTYYRGTNNIIWGNTSSSDSQIYIENSDLDSELCISNEIIYSDIENSFEGDGNIDVNPDFVNPSTGAGIDFYLENLNWQLSDNSVCRSAGFGESEMGAYGEISACLQLSPDTLNWGINPQNSNMITSKFLTCYNYSHTSTVFIDSISFSSNRFQLSEDFPIILSPLDNYSILIDMSLDITGVFTDSIFFHSNSSQGLEKIISHAEIIPVNIEGTIIGEGDVSGTWTSSNSPYYVTSNVIVPNNDFLIIEPGTEVYFLNNSTMLVNGYLNALGTESDSISFSAFPNDSRWGGIILDVPDEFCNFSYCNFSRASYSALAGDNNGNGGAILGIDADITIENSTFFDNIADNSGAAICSWQNYSGEISEIRNCSFFNNQSNWAIISFAISGDVLLENCKVYNNSTLSDNYGGQIVGISFARYLYVNNLLITENTARYIPGLYISHVNTAIINNTTISGNTGWDALGSGLAVISSDALISNCIISGNNISDDQYEVLIHSQPPYHDISDLTIQYSFLTNIIAYENGSYVPNGEFEYLGTGNILGSSLNFTSEYSLQANSVCIDTGTPDTTNLYIPPYDIVGNDRINNDRIDMGAYEFVHLEANFYTENQTGYLPFCAIFHDSSVPRESITNWSWDFGDGSIYEYDEYQETISHLYEINGDYSVSLTVTDINDTTSTLIRENYISVLDLGVYVVNPMGSINIQEDEHLTTEINLNDVFIAPEGNDLLFSFYGNNNIDVEINNSGIVIIEPDSNWFGEETIYFVADDQNRRRKFNSTQKSDRDKLKNKPKLMISRSTAIDSLHIFVTPINDPPILDIPDSIELEAGHPSQVYFYNYCSQTWGEDDQLTLTADNSENIDVFIYQGFNVLFIPSSTNWTGSESITFYLNDNVDPRFIESNPRNMRKSNTLLSEVIKTDRDLTSQTIEVSFIHTNNTPVIQLPDTFTFDEDSLLIIDFSTYISDIESEDLSLSVSGNEAIGVVIIDTLVEFSAPENWNGSETIIFTVDDNQNRATSSDTVEVIVNPVDDPPEILYFSPEDTIIVIDNVEVINQTFTISAYDVDGDELSYSWFVNETNQDVSDSTFNYLFIEGEYVVNGIVTSTDFQNEINWHISSYVSNEDNLIPRVTQLYQNIPNPFNPETTISYQLSKDTYVELQIYNVKGQYIETLVSNDQKAGSYNVIWEGENNSSGIYFYSLETKNYSEIKKMLLIK